MSCEDDNNPLVGIGRAHGAAAKQDQIAGVLRALIADTEVLRAEHKAANRQIEALAASIRLTTLWEVLVLVRR